MGSTTTRREHSNEAKSLAPTGIHQKAPTSYLSAFRYCRRRSHGMGHGFSADFLAVADKKDTE